MSHTDTSSDCAVIWQGFRHEWTYNHRLNRLGSYVAHPPCDGARCDAIIGHTAASGTGDDTAQFTEFTTKVASSQGVAFQSGYVEVTAECQRGNLTPFIARIDGLELGPELRNRDIYTVILNGFDLCAAEHSEKIMTFDVEVTDPTIYAEGSRVRFLILGHLRFDCRSPECQLLPLRLETESVGDGQAESSAFPGGAPLAKPRLRRGIDRRRVDKVAIWLKRQLQQLTDVEEVKRSIIGEDGDTLRRRLFRLFGREYFLRFLKWRFSAPYILRLHYLIIAGNRDALKVTESAEIENRYEWDLENEILRDEMGTVVFDVAGGPPQDYAANILGFRRLYTDVCIDEEMGSEDPIQWGKGMHLLEWNLAIRDVQAAGSTVTAALDLFYKNWSEAMNEVITITTWGAVRAAGRARLGGRLALLQFRNARIGAQEQSPGRIYWPGRGLSAINDPRARCERRSVIGSSKEA